jgi:hypothetical protein
MKKTSVLVHEAAVTVDQSAESFRGYEQAFKEAQDRSKRDLEIEVAEHRQAQVRAMIEGEITDLAWDELVGQARKAAERGEKQYLLLRFPSELCTDESRAINNPPNPTWPQTLQAKRRKFTSGRTPRFGPLGSTSRLKCLTFLAASPVT